MSVQFTLQPLANVGTELPVSLVPIW